MKQKQVKTSPKAAKQTRGAKKLAPPKRVAEEVEESDDEEEVVQKKVIEKKSVNKNAKPVKVVQEPSEDEDEDDDVDQDAENDDDDELGDEEIDDDEEDQEDEDAGVEDGDDDEEHSEVEEDDDDDDEEPSEEPVQKEEPTIPSKIKSGPISPIVPPSRIIHIKKLPKKCKQISIVETFAKYGAIDQIHLVNAPNNTFANVAYKTEMAAIAACAGDMKDKVNGVVVSVKMNNGKANNGKTLAEDRDRTISVKFMKPDTTEEEIRNHFESCGEIENISTNNKFNRQFAFITFKDKSSLPAALALHNSVLNDANIKVSELDVNHKDDPFLDQNLSILLRNKQNFTSIDVAKLVSIFSKCGEIAKIDAICRKNVLAFIKFKIPDGAQNALMLNGKTEEGVELEIEVYDPIKKWTSIYVSNLSRDCTVEDLTAFFSKAGEVDLVTLKRGSAVIRFKDCDGYCKSFLYNESYIKGNIIFIKPNSFRKKPTFKPNPFHNKGFKRPGENGNSVFRSKKPKF